MQQKVSFNVIIDGLVAINGCSRNTAETFLKELFLLIPELLQQNKGILIRGIGSFKKVTIDGDSIIYEPDSSLLEFLNQPFSCFDPIELDDLVTEDIFDNEISLTKDGGDIDTAKETIIEKLKTEIVEPKLDEEEFFQEHPTEAYNSEDTHSNLVVDAELNLVNDDGSTECNKIEVEQSNVITYKYEKSTRFKTINYVGIFVVGLILGFAIGYIVKDVMDNNRMEKYLQIPIYVDSISNKNQSIESLDSILEDSIGLNDAVESQSIVENISSDSIIIDKITKNRFLTTMARQHYGNLNFWVYIYEENASKLGHPDRIKPGTVVVIPPKSKYKIDPLDENSINVAKLKSKEIYAKFRKKD